MLIVGCPVTSRFIGSIRQTSVSPHQSAAVGDREPGLGFVTTLLHGTMIAAAAAPNTTQPSEMSAPNIESSDILTVSGV